MKQQASSNLTTAIFISSYSHIPKVLPLLTNSMANQKVTPFSIGAKDVVLVKPSKPTPSVVLSLSTIDNNPDFNTLCQTIHVYRPNPDHSLNKDQPDPSCVIKEALSKALLFYYPLAGKLIRHADGKLRINCDASGVPFLEANANCELSSLDFLDGIDIETTTHFVFDHPPRDEVSGHHPLVLQVTKFLCGGFTIGMGLSHCVCDGYGASQFFRAMTELASGKDEPSVKPVWERERLKGTILKEPIHFPIDKASSAVSPFWPSSNLLVEIFNVKSESIRRLKMSLRRDNTETIKTLESLGAYVWRSRVRALKLNSDGKTLLRIVVGVRRLLVDPPLPDGYYGNAIVNTYVVLTVKELNEIPLYEVVKLMKQSKKVAFGSDYIKNSINMLETMRQRNVRMETTCSSNVITDWRNLGLLNEVDFGWKGSMNIVPVARNIFRTVDACIFLPPTDLDASMKGGVRVYVCLPEAAMAKFREEMEALEHMSGDEGGAYE